MIPLKQLHPFFYGNREVRTIVVDNQPWFVAKDVCSALDIDTTQTRRLDEDEKGLRLIQTLGGEQEMLTINEAGLYSLIIGSRKPEAKQFKRWITHEVIPSIRKHGVYATAETAERMMNDPDFMIKVFTELKKEKETRAALEHQIVTDKPKVLFAESLQTSQDCILIANLAKLLKQNGVDTGEKRLYRWLRENGYLGKVGEHYNMPTQRSMNLRLFEVKTRTINNPGEEPRISKTTVVTGRGQMYFLNKFKNQTA
ncbi:phage antirepressor KilAC domain-containing protein [Paenibacillus lautus]|uniref:phage antirepressor KilAC domain-containing protein n=1 Tax=Paenibacillus lautus TaxID=1401 RepID=UPI00384E8A3B